MKLPDVWENFLKPYLDIDIFYQELTDFLSTYELIIPSKDLIFNVFHYVNPSDVSVVLFGEDPYPRQTSACGVAFWDKEINYWSDKTRGSSLKNILKGLLIHQGKAQYTTSIEQCRAIVEEDHFPTPPSLFEQWLKNGVFLLNTSLTFSTKEHKKEHFSFWKPFLSTVIRALNKRSISPHYILWGGKAHKWTKEIAPTIDNTQKIISQGHPTFTHQFLRKSAPYYSPFTEIITKTNIPFI